jgi:gluconokinase
VSLSDSQFAALEPLEADERGLILDILATPDQLVNLALATLARPQL